MRCEHVRLIEIPGRQPCAGEATRTDANGKAYCDACWPSTADIDIESYDEENEEADE